MYKYGKILIQKYFEEQSFVDSDIESFNNFVDKELQNIIEENKEIVPTIIPHNIDDFKIKFDGKGEIVGSFPISERILLS